MDWEIKWKIAACFGVLIIAATAAMLAIPTVMVFSEATGPVKHNELESAESKMLSLIEKERSELASRMKSFQMP